MLKEICILHMQGIPPKVMEVQSVMTVIEFRHDFEKGGEYDNKFYTLYKSIAPSYSITLKGLKSLATRLYNKHFKGKKGCLFIYQDAKTIASKDTINNQWKE